MEALSTERAATNYPRRFSPLVFILTSFAAAVILTSIVIVPQWLMKQARWEALRANVGEIGHMAASVVDGDLHRQLLDPANYSAELYARALKPLVRLHSANHNIYYLYTMVDRDGVPYFVLDTAGSPDLRTDHQLRASAYMKRFDIRKEHENDWLKQIAAGKIYITPDFEQDDYGSFLSAHAPIYDSQGRYSGFVGADFDLQYYFAAEARFRRIAIGSMLAALIGALAIGYLAALYYTILQRRAAERERIRVIQDLHDGVLQTLTAITLRLKISAQKADTGVRAELDAMRRLLVEEQKRLRTLIDARPPPKRNFALVAVNEGLLAELEEYWRCHISLEVKPDNAEVSADVAGHLQLILSEAVANAVKHAHASRVTIKLDRSVETLDINICDNGSGFPSLAGTFGDEALSELNTKPRSICERVTSLKGRVTLSTSAEGSQLQIQLPLQ